MITKLTLIPMFSCFVVQGTLIGVYIMSLVKSPVRRFLPSISEIAEIPLGTCIFSQMMNIGAVLMASTIYIRYRHVIEMADRYRFIDLEWLNLVSLIFGLTSTLGASIMTNFQISKVLVVHEVGRILYFTCGLVYFRTQTTLTYYLLSLIGSRIIAHLRYILVSCASLLYVIMIGRDANAWISYYEYRLHTAGTISEWLITLLFAVLILSFAKEFSEICNPKFTLLRTDYHTTCCDLHSCSSEEPCPVIVPDVQPCINEEYHSQIKIFNRIDHYNK